MKKILLALRPREIELWIRDTTSGYTIEIRRLFAWRKPRTRLEYVLRSPQMVIDIEFWKKQTSAPGKFEGEPPETPYFYNLTMNGEGEPIFSESEYDETVCDLFILDAEEKEAFGIANDVIVVWTDSQGFAMSRTFPDSQAAKTWWNEYSQ